MAAGRRFPGNEEALIVTFARPSESAELPQGRGFTVCTADFGGPGVPTSIALCRRDGGSIELFALMAEDVLETIRLAGDDDAHLRRAFLARIAAWQDFMGREGDALLRKEEENGLFGELEVLHDLLEQNVTARSAVTAWQGPLGGLHDFSFGKSALEVKTTSDEDFVVRILSLAQLDDSIAKPLMVAALKLSEETDGRTLPEQVERLRRRFADEPEVLDIFGGRLVRAGYLEQMANRYRRRLLCVERLIAVVDETFPRLIRASVPAGIVDARYSIDVRAAIQCGMQMTDALALLGVS